MLELKPNFKRTRSNRFILKDINIEDFLKYFNSLDNTTPEIESTLKEILTGKLLKKDLEKLPEFTTVCEYIAKYNTLNTYKDSFLIDSNSPNSTSKTNLFDGDVREVKNNSNGVESSNDYNQEEFLNDLSKDLEDEYTPTHITTKLFYILKNNIKIKKKYRKKLYKLWINRSDNRENLNSILSILNSIIAK